MILFENSAGGFLLFQLAFFIAAYLIAKWQKKPGLAAWGLDKRKGLFKQLLLGMLIGTLLYGVTFTLSLLFDAEKLQAVPSFTEILAPLSLFIFGSLFSSFSEDVLTRGYIYNHLEGKLRKGLIIIISASIYVLNHIYRLDDGFVTLSYLFCLGVLYIIPLVLTKRLWFTGGMHWAGNVTFYYTHEVMKTEETANSISPNLILITLTLLMIPLTYAVLKAFYLDHSKP